jgi:3-oxoacyl-[acyl-carrier-protein] synthase-3
MIASIIEGVKISGVASAVPTRKVMSTDYIPLFGNNTVSKIIATTGVKESYHVNDMQTAGDLAYAAGRHLLDNMGVPPESIGVLIFIVTYQDYFVPATANVLHHRLGLSKDCMAFDVNLSCSGFVIGLQIAGSLLKSLGASRALLLLGDTTSKVVSPDDRSRMLFGDAGAAVMLEADNSAENINFGIKTDGSRFKSIIVPAGAFRQPNAGRTPERWFDGNIRTNYNLFMDGQNVFAFSITDVPSLIFEFLQHHNIKIHDFDVGVFHQPNVFILNRIAKKIGLPLDKMPLSLDKYGNTSCASIPVTLSDAYGSLSGKSLKTMFCGFGVGLSWAVASCVLDADVILPVIHTDEYYNDGLVNNV